MKNTLRILSLMLVLASVLSLGGCFLLPEEEAMLEPVLVQPEAVTYSTEAVARGDLKATVQVTAYFQSIASHNLFYENAGRVSEIAVSAGDFVSEGDVLMALDTGDLEKQIENQKITLQKMELNLEKLEASQQNNSYSLKSARLDLEAAQEVYVDLSNELSRAREAYFAAVSDTQKETCAEKVAECEQKVRAQERAIEKIEINIEQLESGGTLKYDLAIAQIDLDAARNTLAELEERYENCVLRAPIDGRVNWIKNIKVGDNVSAYDTLIVVTDPENLVLQYYGSDAPKFPIGLDATVRLGEEEYAAQVMVNPDTYPTDVDGKKQNYVQFVLEDGFSMDNIEEGDSCLVSAVLDSREDALYVNKNRITNYMNRTYVNVLEDGVKVERDVEVGLIAGTKAEILDGLEEGELIIVN